MAHLTQHNCNAIARQLNQRPRKRLGFRTTDAMLDDAHCCTSKFDIKPRRRLGGGEKRHEDPHDSYDD